MPLVIETRTNSASKANSTPSSTAPINKESLKLAGSPFPGHTEMLTALCGASESLMCFFAGDLRVFLLTIHVQPRDAIKAITKQGVARPSSSCRARIAEVRPHIALALLSRDSIRTRRERIVWNRRGREIEPAVKECEAGDLTCRSVPGRYSFLRAAQGEFDAVVACYHDQGLIAVKCLAFGEAVNVTLGLPIIRTSVDHGTAFDIAGRGVADHGSMVEAIKLAARLAQTEVKICNY